MATKTLVKVQLAQWHLTKSVGVYVYICACMYTLGIM